MTFTFWAANFAAHVALTITQRALLPEVKARFFNSAANYLSQLGRREEARMSTRPGLPKLIATDLDGTLVRSDDTVAGYTHEVLARVKAAGIRVVGATGCSARAPSV